MDIKQAGNRFYVIEIGDNPNVTPAARTACPRMRFTAKWKWGAFLKRIEARKRGCVIERIK